VRTGIAGLVEVDHTAADVTLDVALERRGTARDRRKVPGAHEEFVIVLEEETAFANDQRSVLCVVRRAEARMTERKELSKNRTGLTGIASSRPRAQRPGD